LGERWCQTCQNTVEKITGKICPICGDPQPSSRLCPDCQSQLPAFQALRSWGRYAGALRKAILRLKYGRDMGLAEALSKHLIELYNDLEWNIELVVPVPLSAARMQQRGYNQAGLLARPLALAIQKPFSPHLLRRVRETQSQTRLSAQERRQT